MQKMPKASVRPASSMNLLSHREIAGVMASNEQVFRLFRECALAVLNTGNEKDDAAELLDRYADFDIRVVPESRGVKLEVTNSPASAFVDGLMIRGVQDHLFAALRDIVFTDHKLNGEGRAAPSGSAELTDVVFRILRNAGVVRPNIEPNLVVCWGGHAIGRDEYEYSKQVGYELGLRGLDIATGCGIGAMKGPMKGAFVGHGKQQIRNGRYIGITEPGIIASESPNPTVSELVILPDIEKRLEAFVRLAHAVVVFPGGAGTAEEVLYLLGLLMHPDNQDVPLPLIFAAPAGCEAYFEQLDRFIGHVLGEEARRYYTVLVGQPEEVARCVGRGIEEVLLQRRRRNESFAFNWGLRVPPDLQLPFHPTHESMAALRLDSGLPPHELASHLRRAFSGIVAGNVKAFGIRQIREFGPYPIRGERGLMRGLDQLLQGFVAQGRMKIGQDYTPCYRFQE